VNRSARYDVPVMVVLLAIVVLGASWALADGSRNDDDSPSPPRAISADSREYKPGLLLDVYRPEGSGPFPAALLIHGGGLRVGSRTDLGSAAAQLADAGILAASVDYTLDGTEKPARDDVADAHRWLARQPDVDRKRIAVLGRSAGCSLAAWLAFSTNEPRAAVLIACPTFVPDLVTRAGPETLLVHGDADTSVPIAFSREINGILTQAGVTHDFVVGEGVEHFNVLAETWDEVAAWLLPRLKR
jgi:acetyl esterase/lipase